MDLRDSAVSRLFPTDWDSELSSDLSFGQISNQGYSDLLGKSNIYLEYGAGASTLHAVKIGKRVVAVESDENFIRAIEAKCSSLSATLTDGLVDLVHANIGRTGPWGKPMLPSIRRPAAWRRYPLAPWKVLGRDFRADFILVDGRFRVACALAVALQQPDIEWDLLVDD